MGRIIKKCLLLLSFCSVLFLTACDLLGGEGSFDIEINGIKGISDINVDVETNIISFEVLANVTTFDVTSIQTNYEEIEIKPVDSNSSVVTLKEGLNEFTINFTGEVMYLGKECTIEEEWYLNITRLSAATVESIEVSEWKVDYYLDEVFEEGKLLVKYSDNSTFLIDLKSSMVSGFDTSKVGVVEVTIEYSGKTFTTNITVTEFVATLVDVNVLIWYSNYTFNQEFRDGMLELKYDNGVTKRISLTEEMVTGFDSSVVGEYEVTITYNEFTFKKNIFISEPLDGSIENYSNVITVMVKFMVFVEFGVVEGDEDYTKRFDSYYNDFYYDEYSREMMISMLELSGVTDEDVDYALDLLEEKLPEYQQICFDIIELLDSENALLDITEYIYNDWDNHIALINEITDFFTTSQYVAAIMFFVDLDNHDTINGLNFEEYLEYVEKFDIYNISEIMEKYFNTSGNFLNSEVDWFTFVDTIKNIVNVLTNFDKEDLKLMVDTINGLLLDPENVSTVDLTKSINLLGELLLDFYEIAPNTEFVTGFLSYLFDTKLVYPIELVEVLALVLIDFTADDMLEVLDILKSDSDYMILEILHCLSVNIVSNIDLVYDGNFEDSFAKYFYDMLGADINKSAEFSSDLYKYLVLLSNTSLTEGNKGSLNDDLMNLLSTVSELVYNPFDFWVYGSTDNTFIIEQGLSENDFYNYLNSNSRLYYDGISVEFTNEITQGINLNKSGIQYLVINIDGNVLSIPVYVVGEDFDLELKYFYVSNDITTYYERVSNNVTFSNNLYFNIEYYDASDDLYFSFRGYSNLKNENVHITNKELGVQEGLLEYYLFNKVLIYLPIDVLVYDNGSVVEDYFYISKNYNNSDYNYSSFYQDVTTMSDLIFIYNEKYVSNGSIYTTSTEVSIEQLDVSTIDFTVTGSQTVQITYKGQEYITHIYIYSYIDYIDQIISHEDIYIEQGSSVEDKYLILYEEIEGSVKYNNYSYVIKMSVLIDLLESKSYDVDYSEFNSSVIGNHYSYVYCTKDNKRYSFYLRVEVYEKQENLSVLSIKKLRNNDNSIDTYFYENKLSLSDCDDINSSNDLNNYGIEIIKDNFLNSTKLNLVDFIRIYDASINVDIESSMLLILIDDQVYSLSIDILSNIAPIEIRSSYYSTSYYYNGVGYTCVEVTYCDLNTNQEYCVDIIKQEIGYTSQLEGSYDYQSVQIVLFGLHVYVDVYVYSSYECVNATAQNNFVIGLDDIENFDLNLRFEYYYYYNNYNYNHHYSYETITSNRFTVTNKDEIDLEQFGVQTLIIDLNGTEYNILVNFITKEQYIYNLISDMTNKILINTNLLDSTLIINEKIEGSSLLSNYYGYYNLYTINIGDFVDYAESIGVDITLSAAEFSSIGFENIYFNFDGYSKSIQFLVIFEVNHGVIFTSLNSGQSLTVENIEEINAGTNLFDYYIDITRYDYYYYTYEYTISLAELKYIYNASISIEDSILTIELNGIVYTLNINE